MLNVRDIVLCICDEVLHHNCTLTDDLESKCVIVTPNVFLYALKRPFLQKLHYLRLSYSVISFIALI